MTCTWVISNKRCMWNRLLSLRIFRKMTGRWKLLHFPLYKSMRCVVGMTMKGSRYARKWFSLPECTYPCPSVVFSARVVLDIVLMVTKMSTLQI